jgi:hypothetical protein
MSDAVVVLIVMTLGTYALKSAGPLVLGARSLPVRVQALVDLLPAALLAALTLMHGSSVSSWPGSRSGDGPHSSLSYWSRRLQLRSRGSWCDVTPLL